LSPQSRFDLLQASAFAPIVLKKLATLPFEIASEYRRKRYQRNRLPLKSAITCP
jgi:hypothetical protein